MENNISKNSNIRFVAMLLIFFGVYNLIGTGDYKQFLVMFKGLPNFAIFSLYIFTVFYGICCAYCGAAMLRLEDWARKVIVVLTSVSVILGFLLNKLAMGNFKTFLYSGKANVSTEMVGQVYIYIVIFTAIVTIFELFVVFFFTRPRIVKQFA